MTTVNELTGLWLKLLEMAEDPDMDQEAIAEAFDQIEGDVEYKAEGMAMIRTELLNNAEACRKEADRLLKRARSFENNAGTILSRVEYLMRFTNKLKFKTTKFSFNIQKNPPSLVIDDDKQIPPEYLIIEYKANKSAIKDAIKAGDQIEFAHMEQTEGLRIR